MKMTDYLILESKVRTGISIVAIVLSLIAGCTAMYKTQPDTTSAGDNRTIAEHARLYWNQTAPVKEVPVIDPLMVEDAQITGYRNGFIDAIKKVKETCDTQQNFTVDGVRYGCLALRQKGDDDGFNTGD